MQIIKTYIYFFTLIFLIACSKKTSVSHFTESHYAITNQSKSDSVITSLLKPYKTKHDGQMFKVLATADGAFVKADGESTLGNFFCDAVIYETKKLLGKDSANVNVAVFNKGGLRNSLPKGNITVGNIFELMPFDNEVVLLKLSGSQFKDMCYKIAEKGGIPIGGMTMELNGTKFSNVTVNGKPFNDKKDYWVVTSDYLANGGDNYSFFKNAIERKPLTIFLRDVVINYCIAITKQNKTLKPILDGRISISK